MDLSLPMFEIAIKYDVEPEGLLECESHRKRRITSLSSMDSDLEAFSHNPTDGSFAALAVQPTAMTKYLNQRFLSY